MLGILILLFYQIINITTRRYYVTFNRGACSWDQSDCDGSQTKPFSNPIFAFRRGIYDESQEKSGILEFLFEAGGHTILPMDFLGQSSLEQRKSPFEAYDGKFFFSITV
jgi:hypothetical protein